MGTTPTKYRLDLEEYCTDGVPYQSPFEEIVMMTGRNFRKDDFRKTK